MNKLRKGKVFLVGGGPGDPDLITLKGAACLAIADTVIYDALICEDLLYLCSSKAKRVYVGKQGGKKSWEQERINQLLLKHALRGETVVRLKGGDPSIFGRGGEETFSLKERGIAFEIIPGITAALGAAASTGIPLTHRDYASQVNFLTAHETEGKEKSSIEWNRLLPESATNVFYMGIKALPSLTEKLIRQGFKANTPVGVVEKATYGSQRYLEGTLKSIAIKVEKMKLQSPSLIIVGNVVRERNMPSLNSNRKPLMGEKVLITRAGHQQVPLKKELEKLGAEVSLFPVIDILPPKTWNPLDKAIRQLGDYEWIVFGSINGIQTFFDRLSLMGKDSRSLGGLKIAAIGSSTADYLSKYFLKADLVPKKFVSESMLASFKRISGSLKGKRLLLIRADLARPVLKEGLQDCGAIVNEVIAYRIGKAKPHNTEDVKTAIASGELTLLTFMSAATAQNTIEILGKSFVLKHQEKVSWISIGPITTKRLKDLGVKKVTEANPSNFLGLSKAIQKSVKRQS